MVVDGAADGPASPRKKGLGLRLRHAWWFAARWPGAWGVPWGWGHVLLVVLALYFLVLQRMPDSFGPFARGRCAVVRALAVSCLRLPLLSARCAALSSANPCAFEVGHAPSVLPQYTVLH